MGDFATKSVTKTAERTLATPIADMTSFLNLVQTILDTNPWGNTSFEEGGVSIAGTRRGSEYYSGKVVFQNDEAKVIGYVTVRAPTAASFGTCIANTAENTALATAMGGIASHDSSGDSFSVTLRCHAANGEQYTVTLKRDKITIGSYEADAIVTTIETWADGIPALA